MAESVVVQPPQRFFCHVCNVEIENVSSEFTCPLCAGGFIEELPPATEQPNISEDIEMGNDYDSRLTEHISSLLVNSLGDVRQMDDDSDQSSTQDGGSGSTSTGNSSYGPRRTRNRRLLAHRQDSPTFDNIMHEFMISITGGGIAGGAVGNGANGPMFFMGNPGDYAWGREGLDTVITQMLNQMENSGPPPLSKEKIQDIPRVEIDDEQVDRKLQCSVCWDDFQKQETVRKLPCTHIYHENCIVPWLQLHGTCPVCRKTVDKETAAGEQQQQQSQQPQQHAQQLSGLNISNRLGQVYRALNYLQGDNESVSSVSSDGFADQAPFISTTSHHQQQPQQSNAAVQPHQTPSSSTSTRTNSQPPQASSDNNLASRRDDDGNVEFDFD